MSLVFAHSFLSVYQGILQCVTSHIILRPGINSDTVKSKNDSPPIFTTNLSFSFSALPVKLTPHHPGTLLIFLIASSALIFAEMLLVKSFFSILFNFKTKIGRRQLRVLYKSELAGEILRTKFVGTVLEISRSMAGEPFKCPDEMGLVVIVEVDLLLQAYWSCSCGIRLIELFESNYF